MPKRSIIPPVTLRKHLDFRAERPCLLPWGRRRDSSPSDEWMMDGQIECLQPHHSDDMNNSDGGKWLVVQKLALKSLLMFLLCWETWKKRFAATCYLRSLLSLLLFKRFTYFCCNSSCCLKWSLNLGLNSAVLSLNIKLDGILKGDYLPRLWGHCSVFSCAEKNKHIYKIILVVVT